jgi:hypothetical protein
MPNGDLIAGGWFDTAGGVSVNKIARWNGLTWAPLGSGLSSADDFYGVFALAVMPSGDLIAGGSFNSAGGIAANNVARWNGAVWDALGSGVDAEVRALKATDAGDVAVGGLFVTAGTSPSSYFARYTFGLPAVSSLASVTTCPLEMASFNATATSDSPLTYAWRHASTPIDPLLNPSASTETLVLSNVQPADSGFYDCVITNACGSVTSNAAVLTIRAPSDRACGGPGCDPDVNHDGLVDQADIDYLITAIAGGENPTGIDPDFNHDGNVDQGDVDALLNYVAGGPCP